MEDNEPKEVDLEHELETLYLKTADPHQLEGIGDSAPLQGFSGHEKNSSPVEMVETRSGYHREGRSIRSYWGVLSAVFLFIVIAMVALSFWPTIYHFDAFHSDGKVYPVRINRLTGDTSFFDGKFWSPSPVPASAKKPVSPLPAAQPAFEVPPPVQQIDGRNVDSATVTQPDKMQTKTGYTIQIKAFPENKKKDAVLFVENLKQKLPDIRLETIHVPGHGVWHRILLGNFSSKQDAADHMKQHKISTPYPDSFIQTNTSNP